MAHPKLIRRGDPRVFLAAGTAAALLTGPAAFASAADALPLEDVTAVPEGTDCSAVAAGCSVAALPSVTEVPADPDFQAVVGPIEKVVDDVLQSAPVVSDVVEQAPAVVDTVTESVPAPVPVVPDVLPATPLDPAAPEPVGTANAPTSPVPTSGPAQAGSTVTTPFRRPAVAAADTTTTRRVQAFAAPVVSGPIFADLPRVAEEFLASRPSVTFSTDAFPGLGGGQTDTVPGPDAASWLLATAGGMLLLVSAGHLVHARRRYVATIAR